MAHTHHLNLSWKIAPLQVNRKQITLLDLQSIWLKRAVGYNTETIILGNNIFHHLKTYKPVLNNKGKKAPFFYINGHNNNNSKCIIASGEEVDAFKKWINVVWQWIKTYKRITKDLYSVETCLKNWNNRITNVSWKLHKSYIWMAQQLFLYMLPVTCYQDYILPC